MPAISPFKAGATLSGSGVFEYEGNSLVNNGEINFADFIFSGTSEQTVTGIGTITNLNINNLEGVSLMDVGTLFSVVVPTRS